jgi:uncharacterized membrane-anchored protein YitT (DUF2179 family)
MRRRLWNWGLIVIGALIYAVGLNAFLVANHLAEGGFVGISLLLLYKLRIPVGATFLVLNIPLIVISWRLFGHEFVAKTALGVLCVSLFSALTARIQLPTHDPLLAALYAGVVTGFGLGLIFRSGATTGGSDIIARLVRHYRGVRMGRTLFAIDVVVITLVAVIIGRETAMYSLVALFVASRVVDFVIEGAGAAKSVMVVSDRHQDIAQAVHNELGRGTTLLVAKGGYTGREREVVYCVVSREEVNRLQRLVSDIDPRAFVVVGDVHEVLGEGFTYESEPQA